ncbi:MAG: TlpA family protein disulfide reductase, partial [Bacteroidaceae bacterium]|nr:TlpA family protein disulfide reductase [Bacteroidaceae bacterium]
EAETPDGQLHHLAEYAGHGQYVLLDFWASWCGPCIASFPLMKQMHEEFGERGLRIIGVSIDQDKDSWLNAVDKYQLPWLQLRETIASQSNRTSASEKYGITGVPTLVLIAPDGIVISTDLDRKELKTKLEEIFEGK